MIFFTAHDRYLAQAIVLPEYIREHYLGCNSTLVNLTGKNREDIAEKTNDEIGGSWETGLFDKYTTDLFEYTGMKTYAGLFHHPYGSLLKITLQKSSTTTIEGTAAGTVGITLSSDDF